MSQFLRSFMGSGNRPWLRKDVSQRLFTLHLTGVQNPLDPDPLWESQYAGGSSITEVVSKSHSRRLKDALDAHRKLTPQWDEFGFPIEKMLVFTDVVVWVPEKMWNSSSREGGEHLFMMSEKLKYRHRSDFGEEFYKEKEPRYAIMPLKYLAENEVVFQFGLGVFLPSDEDKQVADVKILQAGQEPASVPSWIFFEGEREIERPSALYSEQHFLLLGHTLNESAIQSPYWIAPSEGQESTGYIMMDTHRQPERTYGDDEVIEAGKVNKSGGNIHCQFHSLVNKDDKLQLYIQPHIEQTQTSNTYQSSSSDTMIDVGDDDQVLSGLTSISTEETPDFLFHLSIAGIVLPRIDVTGVKCWLLHLNEDGMPAEEDETVVYQVRGNNQEDLLWRETNIEEWQSLTPETELPFLKPYGFYLRQPVVQDKHYGILPLTQLLSYPVSSQKLVIGRNENNRKNNADIALSLLGREDSIEWNRITRRKQTMENLGTSAQHIRTFIKGSDLQVQQLSQSSPTYILQDGIVIQTLAAKSNAKTSIKAGQEIIIGNYLLQFQKDYIRDEKA